MKKKTIIIIIIAVALAIAAAAVISVLIRSEKSTGIIDIEVSEEALALYADFAESGSAAILEEGTFDAIVPSLYDRGEQELPDVTVKNQPDSFKLGDTLVYTLGEEDSERTVLYIHGGAWVFEMDSLHVGLCDRLATSMDAKVYMPLYPLAPQKNCEDTYEAIYELYSRLSAENRRIFVMGDSAGGNITLGLLHLIKEKGDTMPEGVVLISPCADMSFSNPEIIEVEKTDPYLRIYGSRECAKLWAGERSLEDPLLSAVNADVSGYPRIMFFCGTCDIVYPDALKLYEKLLEAGNEAIFVRAEGLFHVFPLYQIPEREDAIERICEFCK